ncbi:host specificity factor TipJ family phage tail protein [Inquilinus sp. OTU3971]|uniref:host specificity factor TipJ family phage tail protein n=1 Tax=Inquilinus sp. OTU3971 TaxID=3043855 RepID=UPI00313E64D8
MIASAASEQSVNVAVVYNPLEPRDRTVAKLVYQPFLTLAGYVDGLPPLNEWAVTLNGELIEKDAWGTTYVKPEDWIVCVPVLLGGGGNMGKTILRIVAIVAVAAFAQWASPFLAAGLGFAGSTTAIGIISGTLTAVGGLLVNSLLPAPKPPATDMGEQDSPTYGIDGAKMTEREGVPVPLVYGQFRTPGYVSARFVTNEGDNQFLHIQQVLSEGVIESIDDIEINGQPSTNYSEIEFAKRFGLADQDLPSWFNDSLRPVPKNIRLTTDWLTHRTTAAVDALRLDVNFPRGIANIDMKKGKKSNWEVQLEVRYQKVGDTTWTSLPASSVLFVDKRAVSIRKSIPIPGLANALYDVQIRRAEAEKFNDDILNEVWLSDVNEIDTEDVAYNYTAYLGTRVRVTDQLSGIPTITALVKGIKVPHYDADGQFLGRWWDDNPAWITLDVITNPVYGAGRAISRIDIARFVEWAEFCTAMGLKFNGVFDTIQTLWDALQPILRTGRAQLLPMGTRLSLAIERDEPPVMMFTVGNIKKGTFKLNWLGLQDRANEIEVSFYDKEKGFERNTVRVINDKALHRGDPTRSSSIELKGVTDFKQAWLEGNLQMALNQYVLQTATWESPIEAIACTVGDVVIVQHDMPQWGYGGRLAAGSTTTVVQLDRPVSRIAGKTYRFFAIHDAVKVGSAVKIVAVSTNTITFTGSTSKEIKRVIVGGKDYEVLRRGGSELYIGPHGVKVNDLADLWDTDVIDEVGVANDGVENTTLTLTTPLMQVPGQYSNWMFGEVLKVAKPFRIKSVDGDTESHERTIAAVEYNASVYADPLNPIPTPNYSDLPLGSAQVTDLRIAEDFVITGSVRRPYIAVSWGQPQLGVYMGADVWVSREGAAYALEGTVGGASTGFRFEANQGDQIGVKVVAYDVDGVRADWAFAPAIEWTVGGIGDGAIDPPTLVKAEGGIQQIKLSWNNDAVTYLRGVEIWTSSQPNQATATRLALVSADSYILSPVPPGVDFYFWLRSVTTSGDFSTFTGMVSARAKSITGGDFDITPPAVPTGLAYTTELTADGRAKLVMTWDNHPEVDVVGYDVAVRPDANVNGWVYGQTTQPELGGQPRFEIVVDRGSISWLKIRAYDRTANKSNWTVALKATAAKDTTPPARPTSVTATPALRAIWLSWTNPTDTDLSHIEVFAQTTNVAPAAGAVATDLVQGTTFMLGGLAQGDRRYFFLRSVDTSGNKSAFTAAVQAVVGGIDGTDLDPGAPTAPANLVLTVEPVDTEKSKIIAVWDRNTESDVDHYETAIRDSATPTAYVYGTAAQPEAGQSPRMEWEVPRAKSYYVKIKAVDFFGNKSGWGTATLIAVPRDTTPPAQPTNFAATGLFKSVYLTWTNPADADFSHVEILTKTYGSSDPLRVIATTAQPEIVITGLGANETNVFWLRSVDTSGNPSSALQLATPVVTLRAVADDIADAQITAAKIAAGAVNAAAFASNIEPILIQGSAPVAPPQPGTRPQIIFNTADGKLYRWNGTAWTTAVPTVDLTGQVTGTQIADAAILASKLADNAVTVAKIIDGAIIGSKIQDAAVTAAKIAAGVVDATKFAAGISPISVVSTAPTANPGTGPKVVFNTTDGKLYRWTGTAWTTSVPTVDLTGQVTGTQLADAAVLASKLADNAVTVGKIADGAVIGSKLQDGAVTGAKLAQAAVDATKFAAGIEPVSIVAALPNPAGYTGPKVVLFGGKLYRYSAGAWSTAVPAADVSGQIVSTQIADDAITAVKVATGAIDTAALAANAVSTAKIADGAIAAGKIAAGAVDASKLADGAVSTAKFASGIEPVLIQASPPVAAPQPGVRPQIIFSQSNGKLYRWDGAAWTTAVPSTDLTGQITSTQITDNAISTPKLAAGAVTAGILAANAVTAGKIAADAVTAGTIAAAAISAREIAAGAVSATKLSIGSWDNLVNDPEFTFGGADWNLGNWSIIDTPYSGSASSKVATVAGSTANQHIASAMIEVSPGDQYYVEADAISTSDANGAFALYAFFYDKNGTNLGLAPTYSGDAALFGPQTAWVKRKGVFTMPANVRSMRVAPLVYGIASPAGSWRLSKLYVRKLTGTVLIEDGAITADKLVANAVTAGKVAADAITTRELAAGSVTAANISALAVISDKIAASAITADKIATNAVTADKITAGSITTAKLATGAVTADTIAANAITTVKIATGAVTANELAANSVVAGKIAAAAVSTDQLAANAITTDKLAANAITASKLAIGTFDNLVPDPVFAEGGAGYTLNGWVVVDTPAAADLGVIPISSKIARGTPMASNRHLMTPTWDVAPGEKYLVEVEAVSTVDINAPLTSYIQLWKGDGSTAAATTGTGTVSLASASAGAWRKLSVTVTIPADVRRMRAAPYVVANASGAGTWYIGRVYARKIAGSTLIEDGAITTDKVVAGAITANELATNSVTTAKINAGAVTANELAVGAVTADKLSANSVIAGKIAAGAVSTNELAANSITSGKLQANSVTAGAIAAGAVSATQLAAGAITTDKIAAGAVVADKLAVGTVSQNLTQNGGTEIEPTDTAGWYVFAGAGTLTTIATSLADMGTRRFDLAGPQVAAACRPFPVKPGAKYRVQFDAAATSAGSTAGRYARLIWWKSDLPATGRIPDTSNGVAALIGPENGVWSTAVQHFDTTVTAPADVKWATFAIYNWINGPTNLAFDNVDVRADQPAVLIQDGSIIGSSIVAQTITADQLAANSVTTAKINAGAVTATELAAGSVLADKLAANSVIAGKIATGAVTAETIAANAVTAGKLAANAVTAGTIAAGAVSTSQLAAGAVSADKIAAGAITTRELAVGTFDNLVVDPVFLNGGAGWSLAGVWSIINSPFTDSASTKVASTATGTTNRHLGPASIEVAPNEQYFVEIMARASSDANGGLFSYIIFYDKDGTQLTAVAGTGTSQLSPSTTWQYIRVSVTVPANARLMWIRPYAQAQSSPAGSWYVSRFYCSRKSSSVLIEDGAVTASKITADQLYAKIVAVEGNAFIKSAHIESLSAAQLTAGTALAGSITVGGKALTAISSDAATGAQDPVGRINAGTTQIDPGKVTISGATKLSDWRFGGDTTQINGGAVAANTITANKVEIGVRGVSVENIQFNYAPVPSSSNWTLTWTGGFIAYVDDTGVRATSTIPANSTGATWTAGTVIYVFWIKGASSINFTTTPATAFQSDRVVLCAYRGGSNIVSSFGKTMIDGDSIRTGTITAAQLTVANAVITATAQIQDAVITSAKIASLDAAKLTAGTALAGSITVSGKALTTISGEAALGASDPAARINGAGTLIDPGKIWVAAGQKTLADWRYGPDATLIDGGNIAANTIKANKIDVGLRGVTTEVQFSTDPGSNRVFWSGGWVIWTNASGQASSKWVNGGQAQFTGANALIMVWPEGADYIVATDEANAMQLSNHVILARYVGGTNLTTNWGRTIIDGSEIRTGSVRASQLVQTENLITNSAQIGNLTVGSIHVQDGSLSSTTSVAPGDQSGIDLNARRIADIAFGPYSNSSRWLFSMSFICNVENSNQANFVIYRAVNGAASEIRRFKIQCFDQGNFICPQIIESGWGGQWVSYHVDCIADNGGDKVVCRNIVASITELKK